MKNELFPREESDFKNRVVEIYRYREGDDLTCNRCGVIDDIAAFEIYEQLSSTGVLMARCDCHACGKYIKYLPMSKTVRLFDFNSKKVESLCDISAPILEWYLHNSKKREEVQAISDEMRRREAEAVKGNARLDSEFSEAIERDGW